MRAMADDRERRLRAKNLALLWLLLGVVALFFVMTLVKMGVF
jgi:uncharacterized membrane protein